MLYSSYIATKYKIVIASNNELTVTNNIIIIAANDGQYNIIIEQDLDSYMHALL